MTRDAQLIAEAYYGTITEISQETRLTLDTSMKTMVAQMFNDPSKFWEFLKKVPGMYGALLTNNIPKLQETFKSLGVDVGQINDTVKKSMELFAEYQRGTPVEVRKAIAVNPLRATPVRHK